MTHTVSRLLSDDTLNRIIQIESAGKPAAKAPTSSATGLFQFIAATWLAVVRRHRPDLLEGRTRAQVLALRTDPTVAIELGARFTEDNAKALGPGYRDGDLYLAHFLGVATARKFLRAAPAASAAQLAGPAAVKANRGILAGKTVGEVRAWAERSMVTRWDKAGRPDWIAEYYASADAEDEIAHGVPDEMPKPLMQSKIAQAAGGVGVIGGSEAIAQANLAAEQVRALKDNAAEIGLADWLGHLVQSPRFLAAVAVVALVGLVIYFRWRDYGRGREFGSPRRTLAAAYRPQERSAARQ
jgi:hypothetical protein